MVPTGQTVAEHWDGLDKKGQNMWLRSVGMRVTFTKTREMGREFEIGFGWGDLVTATGRVVGATEREISEVRERMMTDGTLVVPSPVREGGRFAKVGT